MDVRSVFLSREEKETIAARTQDSGAHVFGSAATGVTFPVIDTGGPVDVSQSEKRYRDRPVKQQPYFDMKTQPDELSDLADVDNVGAEVNDSGPL